MLKGIPSILSPQLLKVLMEMGHGDEIVIADGNFPSESMGKNAIVIRADGHGVPELLKAILQLMPLDTYVEKPVALMDIVSGDRKPEIWQKYEQILDCENITQDKIQFLERYEFYHRAQNAYAILATGETAVYANVLLKKGVVK